MQNLHNRRGDLGGGLPHKISDESSYERIISLENLLAAWKEFKRGKTRKPDVQEFDAALEENLFEIHNALKRKIYCPRRMCRFLFRTPSGAVYTRRVSGTGSCIRLFFASSIRFLTKHLYTIRTHAGWGRGRIAACGNLRAIFE